MKAHWNQTPGNEPPEREHNKWQGDKKTKKKNSNEVGKENSLSEEK